MQYKVPTNKVLPGDEVFKLHDTRGIDMETTAFIAAENGMLIDWAGFMKCAIRAGWKPEPLLRRMKQAALDAGIGKEFMDLHFEQCEAMV